MQDQQCTDGQADRIGDSGNVDTESRRRYPLIARLGVVGDRRTAAVIDAHGTVQWFCLPSYDGSPAFGGLLDAERGGCWRLGPASGSAGNQCYLPDNNVLVTDWESGEGELELTDAMLWPDDRRPGRDEGRRVLLRRLCARRGAVSCAMQLRPRDDFGSGPLASPVSDGWELRLGGRTLHLWTSQPVEPTDDGMLARFILAEREEFWAVLGLDNDPAAWSVEAAGEALQDTIRYWREWSGRYRFRGPRRDAVIRSALAIELLSFAPTGAVVAAPTTSLPERLGGSRNYDYRYAWIRDASMAMATLSVLGDFAGAERYLSWLAHLDSATEMPLQVLYRVDGGTHVEQHSRSDLAGYCDSRPVLFGNHAFGQRQIDCFGYLADCAVIYLHQGGRWQPEYWRLISRIADYTVENWRKPGNGIWERDQQKHYVSSKVMSWTTLKRALEFADRTGDSGNLRQWRAAMTEIHDEVMELGWSDRLQSFRQRYGSDTLDASTLLIPLMGFLGPRHSRVVATVQRVEEKLMIDGLVYRFRPEELGEGDQLPMGRFEGAFLPRCFWLAAVYAMMERRDDADAILRRVEGLTGELGLLSEEADSRSGLLLGNTPMIFSHAEYARAVLQLADIWPRDI
jgi:GH15 family glucan-1,4-alpha-glucosidase